MKHIEIGTYLAEGTPIASGAYLGKITTCEAVKDQTGAEVFIYHWTATHKQSRGIGNTVKYKETKAVNRSCGYTGITIMRPQP